MKRKGLNKKSKIVLLTLFLFCLFFRMSFAELSSTESASAVASNYTAIEIYPPQNIYSNFLHKPDSWKAILSKPSLMSNYVPTDKVTIQTVSNYNTIATKSISDVAAMFNATVYKSNNEYAFSYIFIPNDNYDSFTKILKALGFVIKKDPFKHLLLNDSLNSVNLPFTYETSPNQFSTLTGKGVRIAIIDSGIDPYYPDFTGRLKFWNDTTFENYTNYIDYNGHGTHVASIAAGSGSASGGKYKGVAPEADLYIWKAGYIHVINPFSSAIDFEFDDEDLAAAINQAVSKGVDVISMSIGGYTTADDCNGNGGIAPSTLLFFNAIRNALAHNIVVVAANGNDGPMSGTAEFPACINGVIAVGATAKKDYNNNFYARLVNYTALIDRKKINLHTQTKVGGQIVKDFEGKVGVNDDGSLSGFQFTLQTSSWPSTINLNVETEHKDRACYSSADIWWDPGSRSKGDSFWQFSKTLNSGPYIGVELFTSPKYIDGGSYSCPLDGDVWYNIGLPFKCTGAALSCDYFDNYKGGCQNQAGCSWCGCKLPGILGTCVDIPKAVCVVAPNSGKWVGCDGSAKSCSDRTKWPYQCGTGTGCTGTWSNGIYFNIFSKNTPGTKDFVASYSSRGPAPNGLVKPDVTAPGDFICAAKSSEIDTGMTGITGDNICDNSRYFALSGTSMATPHVAGLAALLKQANTSATALSIRNAIISTAQPAGYGANVEGSGRINAQKAVNKISSCKFKVVNNCSSMGDTNCDGVIDMKDIGAISANLNFNCGNAKYNPHYDLNDDCLIDMKDVAIASKNINKKC